MKFRKLLEKELTKINEQILPPAATPPVAGAVPVAGAGSMQKPAMNISKLENEILNLKKLNPQSPMIRSMEEMINNEKKRLADEAAKTIKPPSVANQIQQNVKPVV